jgi:hypothetical protein
MGTIRASNPSAAVAEEPTPELSLAVGTKSSIEHASEYSWRGADREAALLEYFASPSAEMCEMDAAWESALTRYGDEDSDAWLSALQEGMHPLCRVQVPKRSA